MITTRTPIMRLFQSQIEEQGVLEQELHVVEGRALLEPEGAP